MPFGIPWTPLIKKNAFWQIAMTGGLWTESRKEEPNQVAGVTYLLATAYLWAIPSVQSSILWNPVTKGYLLGTGIGTAISWALFGKEGRDLALDFYANPMDTPAKTAWALKEVTKKEQTWDRELAEFFLNGVGLQSKHQRDQAAFAAEVELSRSQQEDLRLLNESIVMGSFTQPYDLYRYGYISFDEYLKRLESMRAKSHEAKMAKKRWNGLSREEQKTLTSTRRALDYQASMIFARGSW